MKINSTRLRALRSKDLELLLSVINNLGYKIEVKGRFFKQGKKWYQSYVLPDEDNPTYNKVPLIVDLD